MRQLRPAWLFGALLLLVAIAACPVSAQQAAMRQDAQRQAEPKADLSPGKVSGRVLSAADARPLNKAAVILILEGRSSETLSVRTGPDGFYEFPEVPPGRYQLRAQRNGYITQTYGQRGGGPGVPITVHPGQRLEKLDMRLERAGVVSGNVVDEDNEPIEGLTVRVQRVTFSPGGRQRTTTIKTTRTDDLGNYRISGLAPGFYYVQAGGHGEGTFVGGSTSGFTYAGAYYPGVPLREEARRVQVFAGQETRGIDVPVRSVLGYAIRGTIYDAGPGVGLRRYNIGISRGGFTTYTGLDRDDGGFVLRGYEPGEYTVIGTVQDAGSRARRGYRPIRIVDSDLHIVIEVGRAAEVRGELRIEGQGDIPLTDLFLSLRPEEDLGTVFNAELDPSRSFIARDVPAGEYSVQLSSRGNRGYLKQVRCRGEDYTSRKLELAAGEVLDDCVAVVATDLARVTGLVRNEDRAAAGAVVVLVPTDREMRRKPRLTLTAQTDEAGQFVIHGVVPGDYFAFAVPPMDDAGYYDIEFPERNRPAAERLTAKPEELHLLELKLTRPR